MAPRWVPSIVTVTLCIGNWLVESTTRPEIAPRAPCACNGFASNRPPTTAAIRPRINFIRLLS